MIGRTYKDSDGKWHNIEASDYDDIQKQISSIEQGCNMARFIGEQWNELYFIRNDGKVYVNAGPTVGRIYDSLEEAISKFDYDKCYVKIEGYWCHRTRLKCIINPILRFLQFWTDKPYVIASMTNFKDDLPYFSHYTMQRKKKLK